MFCLALQEPFLALATSPKTSVEKPYLNHRKYVVPSKLMPPKEPFFVIYIKPQQRCMPFVYNGYSSQFLCLLYIEQLLNWTTLLWHFIYSYNFPQDLFIYLTLQLFLCQEIDKHKRTKIDCVLNCVVVFQSSI